MQIIIRYNTYICCIVCVNHYSREILKIHVMKNIDTVYRGKKT
jgi:hypothetical protein